MEEKRTCRRCGSSKIFPDPLYKKRGPHHAKLICYVCQSMWGWQTKPDTDKSRRSAKHKELVYRYGHGFCEMCLRKEEDLPNGETLEGHHVEPFSDDGDSKRENVWIVCTFCHSVIERQRNYLSHYKSWKDMDGIPIDEDWCRNDIERRRAEGQHQDTINMAEKLFSWFFKKPYQQSEIEVD